MLQHRSELRVGSVFQGKQRGEADPWDPRREWQAPTSLFHQPNDPFVRYHHGQNAIGEIWL